MDRLFVKFLNQVEKFNQLAESASVNLTEVAIANGEPTASMLDRWYYMLNKTKESYGKIKIAADTEISGANAELIDFELSLFRSLWRWTEEMHCIWSTNYKAINDALSRMHDLRIDIDRKYHMGQHRDKN